MLGPVRLRFRISGTVYFSAPPLYSGIWLGTAEGVSLETRHTSRRMLIFFIIDAVPNILPEHVNL